MSNKLGAHTKQSQLSMGFITPDRNTVLLKSGLLL